MTGKKGKSGGPRANSGGARAGAGRPKKERPPTAREYKDALDYLGAVVSGAEAPDAIRVQAARALLPFTTTKKRAPLPSPPPRQLQQAAQTNAESAAREAWRAKAAEVRARLGRKE